MLKPKEYPVELLHVAAVAVAAYQDWVSGVADVNDTKSLDMALKGIVQERARQDLKWGPQQHTREEWVSILAEEFGEVAHAVNLATGR